MLNATAVQPPEVFAALAMEQPRSPMLGMLAHVSPGACTQEAADAAAAPDIIKQFKGYQLFNSSAWVVPCEKDAGGAPRGT